MAVKQEEDGTYTVSYHKRHPVTNLPISRRRIGIQSKAEAQRVFNSLVVTVEDQLRKAVIPTWQQLLEKYFLHLKTEDVTNTTRYNREKHLRFYTLDAWRDKIIDEISTEDIHQILQSQFADRTESYRKFFIKCVRGVFQFAMSQNLVNRNPTPMIKLKIKSKIKNVLNENQILILLRKAQEQNFDWYPHYAVALMTGLRNGELYALKWINVNLEKRQILVNCSWSSKDGFKSTKSGNDRIVEIPNPLLPLLKELKLRSAECDFVLPRLGRWDRGEQAYDLRIFLKSIGLPEIRFHDLRASWATWLLDKGVAPSKVMSQGGWSNLDTMMIYMRKAGINIKDSTSVLDGIQTHGISEAKIFQIGNA